MVDAVAGAEKLKFLDLQLGAIVNYLSLVTLSVGALMEKIMGRANRVRVVMMDAQWMMK